MTTLSGTWRLARLVLRRDRLRLPVWIVGLVALMAVSAAQVHSLYADPARLASYVRTMDGNPALVLFAGPGYGFDDPSLGAVLVNETSLWMALGVALMSVFLVTRHTRAEEDAERADLVRSTEVGRHAPLVAALLVVSAADGCVAVGAAVAAVAAGFDALGSVALGASIGAVGVTFAAAAALAAQIAGSARGALGLGIAAVAVGFVVRGVGDVAAPALSWLTPFGWAIGVRAFAGERWWTLAALAIGTAVVTALALVASSRRDLGSGLVARRGGRADAAPWMTGPLGLAFRLQRGALAGWAVGLFVTGLVYGSVGDDVEAMLTDNPAFRDYLTQLGGASVTDAYLATALRLLALMAGGFAVSDALRCRAEEAAGYAESTLAGAVSRWWWLGSHLVVTIAGTLAAVVAAGLGAGIGYGAATGDAGQIPRLTGAALATLPAVLVLVGVATTLVGWLPRAGATAWGALAVVVVVGVFGTALDLPHGVTILSPLEHTPSVPAEAWRPLPLVVLAAVATALTVAGLVGYRRRDLVAS